jgi:hypothetical protein
MDNKYGFLAKSACCALLFIATAALPSNAAMVYFSPASGQVNTGDEINVDLIATGLTEKQIDPNDPNLVTDLLGVSAFDLTIYFNPDILGFVDFTPNFSSGTKMLSDKIGEEEIFFAADNAISATADVVLGTIILKGLNPGDSKLSLSEDSYYLGDIVAEPYSNVGLASTASIHVPEPSSIILTMSGLLSLLSMGAFRRKKN